MLAATEDTDEETDERTLAADDETLEADDPAEDALVVGDVMAPVAEEEEGAVVEEAIVDVQDTACESCSQYLLHK